MCSEKVCQAITATLSSSGWTEYIANDDLQSGAGSDLNANYWSWPDVYMDITGTLGNWQVDVSRSDINWNTDIMISTRRLSDGTGSGTIADGTSWQTVNITGNYFFNGTQDRTGIQVKFTIANVSLARGAGAYTTTIIYTVYDN